MTIFYIFLVILVVLSLITGLVMTIIEKRGVVLAEKKDIAEDVDQRTKVFEIVSNKKSLPMKQQNRVEPAIMAPPVIEPDIEILSIDTPSISVNQAQTNAVLPTNQIPVTSVSQVQPVSGISNNVPLQQVNPTVNNVVVQQPNVGVFQPITNQQVTKSVTPTNVVPNVVPIVSQPVIQPNIPVIQNSVLVEQRTVVPINNVSTVIEMNKNELNNQNTSAPEVIINSAE